MVALSWQTSSPARAVRVGYSSADYGPLARMGRPAPPTARPHESPDIGARLSPLDDRPGAGRQRRRLALRSTLADRAFARDRRRRDARVLDHALRAHSRARSTDYRRALNRSLRREPGQRTELLHLLDVRICVHTQEVEPLAPVHIPQERVVRLHIEAVGLDALVE